MDVKIEIKGIPELVRNVATLTKNVRTESVRAMKRALSLIQVRAQDNLKGDYSPTPYEHWFTGNLTRNIKSDAKWKSAFVIDGFVFSDVPYAPYVESLPDGGFLWPAIKAEGKNVVKQFEKDYETIIKESVS